TAGTRRPRATSRAAAARRSDERGSQWSSRGPARADDARIELRVEEVSGEVGHDDRDRRQHDDPLDHRIVALRDGRQQTETDALIREDLLDDSATPDDQA